MPNGQRAIRVIGDGLAWQGPCMLIHVIMWPDADEDYADIYDGRDATSGEKFTRVESGDSNTLHLNLSPGVPFDIGVYVDGKDSAVETTVVIVPK